MATGFNQSLQKKEENQLSDKNLLLHSDRKHERFITMQCLNGHDRELAVWILILPNSMYTHR